MVCRHEPGDPNCTSGKASLPRQYRSSSSYSSTSYSPPETPDARNYKILDVVQEGLHLVMKVKYPNCSRCSYEGTKVLVYLNMTAIGALKWKVIDPHFTDKKPLSEEYAPSPAARFPASTQGWQDAITYARSKK
jgi:hypothetical protein